MSRSLANRIPKRALYLVAAACLCVIAASVFKLATTRASAAPDPFRSISVAATAPLVAPSAPVIAQMKTLSAIGSPGVRGQVVSAARQLPFTIAGNVAYLVPTTAGAGGFCLYAGEQLPEVCDAPFSATSPPLLFIDSDPDGSGPIGTTAFGVAEDGVASVTIIVNGTPVTVPVRGNTFEYIGDSSVVPGSIGSVSANFADGHSVKLG